MEIPGNGHAYMRPMIHSYPKWSLRDLSEYMEGFDATLWNMFMESRQVDIDRLAQELSPEKSFPLTTQEARTNIKICDDWLYTIAEYRSFCFRRRPLLWQETRESVEPLQQKLETIRSQSEQFLEEAQDPDYGFSASRRYSTRIFDRFDNSI